MSGLPEGWAWTTLGQITRDCDQRVPDANDEFRYVDIASVDRQSKAITAPQTLLGKEAPSRARKEIRHGDVLVSMTRPNLNAVAMVPEDLDRQIASTGFDVLRASEVDPRWVFNAVRSQDFVERMSSLVQGALYPAVRSKDVRGYELPLAPLSEQKRIADKLDSVLARVDACRDRLDRIPALLKRFRQAVLAAATSGRLTEDWRVQEEVATWDQSETLGSVGTVTGGLTKNAKRAEMPLQRQYLRVANVQTNQFDLDDVAMIGLTTAEFEKTRLQAGDLLIVEGNGSLDQIGRVALWKGQIVDCSHQNHLIRWRAGPRLLAPFALYFLLSPEGRRQIVDVASSTTGLHTLSISKVSRLRIPIPSLAEQHEIVRCVEALFAFADRVEARCAAARKQAGQLTPALLAKAFRGELVPQDPADEPAAELLKRLAARRAEAPKARRGRKPVAAGE